MSFRRYFSLSGVKFIEGLKGGGEKVADWWLMKPFSFRALLLSVLRRFQRSEAGFRTANDLLTRMQLLGLSVNLSETGS